MHTCRQTQVELLRVVACTRRHLRRHTPKQHANRTINTAYV
jgi:hypothetical protein